MITPDRVSIGLSVGSQPPLSRIRLMLRAARLLGFDAAWTIDHFQGFFPRTLWDRDLSFAANPDHSPHQYYDFQALLGYLGPRSGNLHLAVGVTEPVRRHPVLLAQTAMTVAAMTKRQLILGVGAGEAENITPYGLPFKAPVSRFEEAIQVLRLALDSQGPFDFSGQFFNLDRAMMDLTSPPGRTPQIWVAAHGPRMLRLTGTYGDGWYPTLPYTPASYAASLATVRDAAVEAGRDPHQIIPAWQPFTVLGRSDSEVDQILDSPLIRYLALLAPADLWTQNDSVHPLGERFRGYIDMVPENYTRAELESAMKRVPVGVVRDMILAGTPDDVYRELRAMVEAGLRHIVMAAVSALHSKRLAMFTLRHVISIQRKLRKEAL